MKKETKKEIKGKEILEKEIKEKEILEKDNSFFDDVKDMAEENIDFKAEVEKIFKDIIFAGKGKCCVCHHDLNTHIDEGTHWRCHSLGADAFQCECNLSKAKAGNDILFYDLSRRAEEQLEDLRRDIIIE